MMTLRWTIRLEAPEDDAAAVNGAEAIVAAVRAAAPRLGVTLDRVEESSRCADCGAWGSDRCRPGCDTPRA